MPKQSRRFSIYDMLEENGVFDSNPANLSSVDKDGQSLYKGPVEYPKMLYHPEGEERISVPAQAEITPFGPQMLGEQKELVCREVGSKVEERELRDAGWHDHPAKAIAAGNKVREARGEKLRIVPAISTTSLVTSLEAQLAEMKLKLEQAQAELKVGVAKDIMTEASAPPPPTSGKPSSKSLPQNLV